MASSLLIDGLVKRYGALLVTDHVTLEIPAGELHAVIGPNGAGKTTLINQICGELPADEGGVVFGGREIGDWPVHRRARAGLLRSYQITSIFEEFTVLENAVLAASAAKRDAWRFWAPLLADAPARAAAERALAAAGLSGQGELQAGELAYGQRRQLELAMALAAEPQFLLLDEPMAGMSVAESAAVIAVLRDLKSRYTILLVEHDMDAVFALADRISVLVQGRILFTGSPAEVRGHPQVRAVYLGEETAESAGESIA